MVEAIRELPVDATVDDAIERLVFLAKIEEGLAQLDRGEGVPHDEVKRRLGVSPSLSGLRDPSLIWKRSGRTSWPTRPRGPRRRPSTERCRY